MVKIFTSDQCVRLKGTEITTRVRVYTRTVCSYSKPISVARCVMEKSKHSMIVGSGACKFAHDMGFVAEPNDSLMTEETRMAYEKYKLSSQSVDQVVHDTLGVSNYTTCAHSTHIQHATLHLHV